MILNYKMIGKRIQKMRLKKCLTQEKLAEMADLSVSYISYIETAKKKASLESLVKLGIIFDVTVDTFLYGSLKVSSNIYELDLVHIVSEFDYQEKHLIFELAKAIEKCREHKN